MDKNDWIVISFSELPRSKLRGIGLLLPNREVLNLFGTVVVENAKASFCSPLMTYAYSAHSITKKDFSVTGVQQEKGGLYEY